MTSQEHAPQNGLAAQAAHGSDHALTDPRAAHAAQAAHGSDHALTDPRAAHAAHGLDAHQPGPHAHQPGPNPSLPGSQASLPAPHVSLTDPLAPHDSDGMHDALALLRPAPAAADRRPYADASDPGRPTGQGNETSQPAAPAGDPESTPAGAGPAPAAAPSPASPSAVAPHRATTWPEARAVAARAGRGSAREAVAVPLAEALGRVLAGPLVALTDLPSFDTSAMDGWVVAGPGPWEPRQDDSVLAGHAPTEPLADGAAVRIATGARIPQDATAVIRREHSRIDAAGRLHALRDVVPGQDIRPRAQECRTGDPLLPAGSVVSPAVLGLAAAAGYDELLTAGRPRVEVLVLGDELLTEGLPHDGLIRDALGPMLGPWLRALGADVIAVRRVGDTADALHEAVTGSGADLVVTTGGTAAGPVDHVHPVLRRAGAELLVDGVKVRPGHPMLLARLTDGRHLVGLPGNPLAAVSGLLTLAAPLLRALAARPEPEPYRVPVHEEVQGHPYDTRLVPVSHRRGGVLPLRYNGPAMLRGIAAADGLAVVPPGGARPGDELEILDLPWSAGSATSTGPAEGVCFT
ncbi:molybdopterin molybdotransferase MoeA [Streptomyces purpureus]|uniref:molybdopterin molybdotransferase MoeA n=1 Tax=Streptomyces purpureus TaxID=1951 RepID=UPI00036C2A1D|nr:molybdopterin molybdotransferase MoeA [Streptomyces purpureus]